MRGTQRLAERRSGNPVSRRLEQRPDVSMIPRPEPDPVLPGQESVWSYPRPAVAQPTDKLLEVWLGGQLVARTARGIRTLETSHPPTYYFPPEDVAEGVLSLAPGATFCEWKGQARYFDVVAGGRRAEAAAWSYPSPTKGFAVLKDHVAFMPAAMDRCVVGGETARPQEGGFYGGWITSDLAGPFKGPPGTRFW
jgi:uncharacterized protein (DUF427 family)